MQMIKTPHLASFDQIKWVDNKSHSHEGKLNKHFEIQTSHQPLQVLSVFFSLHSNKRSSNDENNSQCYINNYCRGIYIFMSETVLRKVFLDQICLPRLHLSMMRIGNH
ncbi:CLUMA_CG004047, isoform A [Clunio marinus]|uniref:CLUMA_CG004047, isoform A n=1 Tax=Clunio marinus TaxID=568069 RepID=A0A1J1HSB8_9DIPT|nr:CLUMA_CG004047, isoform A [Clunio marinus]